MGLLGKLKKGKNTLSENDMAYHTICSVITSDEPAAMEEVGECLTSGKLYATKHPEGFENRDVNTATASDFTLKWLGITDILIRRKFACEVSEDTSFDDFYDKFGALNTVRERGIMPGDDEIYLDYDIKSWLVCIDRKWQRLGMYVGAIDIGGESFVLFPCTAEQFSILKKQAEKAGRRIYRAAEV
jgi:hypothetical protein